MAKCRKDVVNSGAMLTLYYTPGSCARASHITLREAGADFELRKIDFASQEQRGAAYLSVNPKARVPALQTDEGVLTETPAILAFIAQRFPDAALASLHDSFRFAQEQSFNNYLCGTVHVAHAHSRRGKRWADDPASIVDMKRKTPQNVADCFTLIETQMLAGPWVMGERYSMCDPYLFTLTQWLEFHDIDLARFPKVMHHHQRMLERPAVISTLAIEEHENDE